MGVSAVATSPLPLNHYLVESPEKSASSLRYKALGLSLLEKISWVAFVAIVAAIFAVSYTGVTLTGSLPLVMVGLAILTPVLSIAASHFNHLSKGYAKKAVIEEGVVNELNEIADWGRPQIGDFFREQGLLLDRVPLEALPQKNPGDDPLTALLPLIARFNFLKRLALEVETSSRNQLNHQIERDLVAIEQEQKRVIRLANRQIAWNQHEREAIPRALDAALMLQIIQQPTLELSLLDIGDFRAKSYEERMFDRHFAPVDDKYFEFHPDLHRPPLTLTELEQDLSPRTLRLKLFPPAPVRV